jgi:alpha-galactosidase
MSDAGSLRSHLLSVIDRHWRSRLLSLLVILSISTQSASAAEGAQEILAARADAYVGRDSGAREWAVGSAGLEMIVAFNAQGTLELRRLWFPDTGRVTAIGADVEIPVTLAGEELTLEESGSKIAFLRAAAEDTGFGVRLNLTFEHRASHALITRSYAAYPGSPTIETWTQVEIPSGPSALAVTDLAAFRLTMPAGSVKWVNGMRGGTANSMVESAFAIQGGEVQDGAHLEIGSTRRSSEAFVPIIFADFGADRFYGGLIWSGSWRIAANRSADVLSMRADFPAVALAATEGRPVEFPHAFFGVVDQTAGADSAALRRFITGGIRQGRPFQPLVTYNTWFARGARIDKSMIAGEIERAASLGVELFVLDAGWYEGAGAIDQYDFTSGLGTWRVDQERFPEGLPPLVDLAHSHGMKFGIWVEPERVALSAVNQPGLAKEEWLATQDGSYADDRSAQLCLASEAARQWVLERIFELIDSIRPDYLKWDNNFWLNCDRDGHDHNKEDGNYAHVVALYSVLGEIRRRYPNLIVENVSGGGNRLDFGMLAYSDVGWMDDLTAPSNHVRHNLEGLLLAFPPAYLLSFVLDSEVEPLKGGTDFAHIARSRMPGILGLSYVSQSIDSDLSRDLRREIAQYKEIRDIVAQCHGFLLSAQAPAPDGWDVIQELTDDRRSALIFAFNDMLDAGRLLVRPQNLLPDETYDVRPLGGDSSLGRVTGNRLMLDGVELAQGETGTRAHVLVITVVPPPE